jgi:D-lactate dehydrogenase
MVQHLKLMIEKLKRELYGPRSERTARLIDQMELQLEELEAQASEDEIAAEQAAASAAISAPPRRRPARKSFPEHLPRRMNAFRDRFEHHLILKASGPGVREARDWLASRWTGDGRAFFECTPAEGTKAMLHRFAAAGAAVRYRAVHAETVEDIVALDIALRRNDQDWVETLPTDIAASTVHRLYYGHFFCHVFHQDYIVARGHDPVALEHRMLALLDRRRAAYPAEHNVGHLYKGGPAQIAHFRKLDPCNCMNPGIGGASRRAGWVCEIEDKSPI